MGYTIDLAFIAEQALEKEAEHIAFRGFIKQYQGNVDELVAPLVKKYYAEIDCTQCGNCCKSAMISLTKEEVNKMAQKLAVADEVFLQKYCEVGVNSEQILFNTIPCHFLKENKCTQYEVRPEPCASFPHLHQKDFVSRTFQHISNYGICPMVHYCLEDLKILTGFKK
jgi:uncharacterized protein